MYIIRDQNGLYVDIRAICIMEDDTGKDVWTYHGYTNIYNGTILYPTKERAEKVKEFLRKVNDIAGFNVEFHIEELQQDNITPTEIKMFTRPVVWVTKTKAIKMIKQLRKELSC